MNNIGAVQENRIYAECQFVEMVFVEFFPEEGWEVFCFVCLVTFGGVAEGFVYLPCQLLFGQ